MPTVLFVEGRRKLLEQQVDAVPRIGEVVSISRRDYNVVLVAHEFGAHNSLHVHVVLEPVPGMRRFSLESELE